MKFKVMIIIIIILSVVELSFADEVTIGTVINEVLETDIEAYIDGYKIPSINIDGYTAVVVEDLRNYGFNVVWNPVNRELVVTKSGSKVIEPLDIKPQEEIVIGKKIADVLSTDIKTYFRGINGVESYNIDGQTAVFIHDLSSYGFVRWHEEKRQITLSTYKKGIFGANEDDAFSFKIDRASTTEIDIMNSDGSYYFEGEKIGYFENQAMISLNFLAEQFAYELVDYNNNTVAKKDNYSFKVSNQTKTVEFFYDGQLVKTEDLLTTPQLIGNDLNLSDVDMEYLFGLDKVWNPDTGNIKLSYFNEVIGDYGINAIKGTEFTVHTLIDKWVVNYNCSISINEEEGRNFTMGTYDRIKDNYRFVSTSELIDGSNEIDITISNHGKILMYKSLHDIRPDYTSHVLERGRSVSGYTSIIMSHTIEGYNVTTNEIFPVSGNIFNTNSNSINVIIEKLDETSDEFSAVNTVDIDIISEHFNGSIHLSSGEGLYRITGKSNITYLHGMVGESELFEFYVFYDELE